MARRVATEQIEINWGGRRVVADLLRIEKRAFRIDVRPTGKVAVFAPVGEEIGQIRARAQRKGAWVFAQIDTIARRPSVTPKRMFVSGETHLLLGRQYRLSIEQSENPHVRLEGGRLVIAARSTEDRPHCRRLLEGFYALTARDVFRDRMEAMAGPFVRRGLKTPSIIVRSMTKRWGSFTPSGRIVLNVDLVRASPGLIDYVICHELAHAFFPDHSQEWRALLNVVMPDWEDRKERLERVLR